MSLEAKGSSYNGTIPKDFEIKGGKLNFDEKAVRAAHSEGKIDDHTLFFLLNVLAVAEADPEVTREVARYRALVDRGLKPGEQLFNQVHALGLKHHPSEKKLDISGYRLPGLNFEGAFIGGMLNMSHTEVWGDINLMLSTISDNIIGSDASINGTLYLSKALLRGHVFFCRSKINGAIHIKMSAPAVKLDYSDASIKKNLAFNGAEMNQLDLANTSIGSNLEQIDCTINDKMRVKGLKLGGGYNKARLKVGGVDYSNLTLDQMTERCDRL